MLQYPVSFEQDSNGTVLVSFPDIPEAHTYGTDPGDALTRAADALETALALYMNFRRDIPSPSRLKKRTRAVALPALAEAKIRLYQAMREEGMAKSDLARIEAAFQALK